MSSAGTGRRRAASYRGVRRPKNTTTAPGDSSSTRRVNATVSGRTDAVSASTTSTGASATRANTVSTADRGGHDLAQAELSLGGGIGHRLGVGQRRYLLPS